MKKFATYLSLAILISAGVVWFGSRSLIEPAAAAKSSGIQQKAGTSGIVLACPGRIEGASDSIEIGAAVAGIVQTINVKEGDRIGRGATIAEIGCNDLAAALRVATAEAESLRQARTRLLRGSRDEQRQEAAQKTAAAQAVLEQAKSHLERMQKLHEAGAMARAVLDQAKRDHDVADADLKRAKRNEDLVNAPALQEEVARADADLQAAEQKIQLTGEQLGKCIVRAPIDGTILRVHAKRGELFSTFAPQPIVTMADLSGRRVRAEVDERDLGKISIGQRVVISSDAYPGREISGKVVRRAEVMGRKTVMTGDPSDKSDRDVLEVLAELEAGAGDLPVGLRATVQFLTPEGRP